ncbi:YlbG family protein [Aquisalibacillus elongatus]|uniref:UPF0298 protein EDC24_0993 n=1 Tax=Aquisalibacillus elongatus TaxID=485577 RepID=A0A3N5CBG5_9BACI|nr:YlbG family protein [Aquisalibacillus elongatus]RPF56105.1 uncharacterized protein YlbG (UPF0298 family) [Aquisalibacillus elongatus]
MMLTKRQGIIVWIKHHKYAKRLRKYGHLIYVSRKQKYLLLYVDQDHADDIVDQIKQLNFVRDVEISYKPFVDTTFQTKHHFKEKDVESKNIY